MFRSISKPALVILISCSFSGCKTTNPPPLNPDSGQALREALNKQIVDPTPKKGAPVMHPEKIQAAIDRYLNDQVKEPEGAEEIAIISGGG